MTTNRFFQDRRYPRLLILN